MRANQTISFFVNQCCKTSLITNKYSNIRTGIIFNIV